MRTVRITDTLYIGENSPLVLIAGPCVVESRDVVFQAASHIRSTCAQFGIPVIFKSSFEKANRTQRQSFTGIGMDEALTILADVKREFDLPILTDIHKQSDANAVAEVADVLQIPAFLCRQTDLLIAAGETGRAVNIKKGQFLAPDDIKYAAEKVTSTGNENVLLCERGTSFGYHNLVVDMRSLIIMRALGYPVVMDATHAVQIPSAGGESGGNADYIIPLARAAAAIGIDALFIETHPDPRSARSDAASQLPLHLLETLLSEVLACDWLHRR